MLSDLILNFNLPQTVLGDLTSAVQFGFILGTLLFAVLVITDRFPPSKVFLISALLGAIFNLGMIWDGNTYATLVLFRFLTGFCLAGIYPVGMKIAADYFDKGLGKSLGFLVGALVLGTAFPHLLKGLGSLLPWIAVILTTSILALIGGLLMVLFVPNGPFRKQSQNVDFKAFFKVFKNADFRAAAFGYFGHMWELYTFWAFVPLLLKTYASVQEVSINIPLWSFAIIAIGGFSCVLGGYLCEKLGVKRTATIALSLSAICCLLVPLVFLIPSQVVFIGFLLFWGMVVIADSPLFSTLVAQSAAPELKGTSLTIVNSIGFAVTIISIQFIAGIQATVSGNWVYMLLAIGPVLGLLSMYYKKEKTKL